MRYPLSALSLGILALTASPASAQPLSLIPGDVNGDGIVNSQDLAIISASWGSNYGPADLNGDGIVNSQDLAIVSSDWMKKGPTQAQVAASLGLPPDSAYTTGLNAPELQQIKLTSSVAALGNYGAGVTIGVVDTGMAVNDSTFAGRISAQSACLITSVATGCSDGLQADPYHGTVVTDVAASGNPLQEGIAPKATVAVMKVYNSQGYSLLDEDNGIKAAADAGSAVINVSISAALQEVSAINYAASKGSIIVIAAGNDGTPYLIDNGNGHLYGLTQTALNHIILVGAVTSNNVIESFSDTPGTGLIGPTATVPLENFWLMAPDYVPNVGTGTSYAAPVVAGAVALLDSRWPILMKNGTTPQVLFATATDLGATGVDGVYGNGLLNLTAAFQPVGGLTAQTANGQSVAVSQGVSIQAGGALGSMTQLASALSTYTVFDSFQRDFQINLSGAVSAKPSSTSSLTQAAMAPQAKVSSTNFADGSSLSLGTQDAMDNGVDKPMGHAADENWIVSFTDETGSTVTAGQGFPASASFAGAMWGSNNNLSEQSSSLGIANGVASLAEGGMFTAMGTDIGKDTRVAFGWSETKATDPLQGNNWIAPNANAFNAGLTTKITDGWSAGLTMSMLSEQSGLLGSTYNSNGPISFGSKNETMSMGISSGVALADKTDLLIEAAVARTNGSSNSATSLISNVTPLYATSYGASLAERDMFDDGDRLEFSAKAPLKVVSGSASLTVDSVDANGNPIVGSQNVGLKPNATELDLGMTYRAPVRDNFEWNLTVEGRHDADNVAGQTDLLGLVSASYSF